MHSFVSIDFLLAAVFILFYLNDVSNGTLMLVDLSVVNSIILYTCHDFLVIDC